MGMHDAPSRMTGHTYYVTETTHEDLGNGNILIHNYSRRNGVLVHEFDCIISAGNMVRAGTTLSNFARDISENHLWRLPGEKVH